jgi:hypothetical protein
LTKLARATSMKVLVETSHVHISAAFFVRAASALQTYRPACIRCSSVIWCSPCHQLLCTGYAAAGALLLLPAVAYASSQC